MNYASSKTNSQAHSAANITPVARSDQCPASSADGTPDNPAPVDKVYLNKSSSKGDKHEGRDEE